MYSDREVTSRTGNTVNYCRTWYVQIPERIDIRVYTVDEQFLASTILNALAFSDSVEDELAEAVAEIREWVKGRKYPISNVTVDAALLFSCELDSGYGDNDCSCNASSRIRLSIHGFRDMTAEELEAEAVAKKKRKDAYKKKRDEQAAKEINELRNLAAKYPSEMKRLATMRAKKEKKVKK
jgi:hypothetical protein